MDKATQKSIEWQKANHPMAIGGDAFADIVDSFNVNPAFVAGYKEAEKDLALTWEDMATIDSLITEVSNSYAVGNYDHDGEREHFYGEVLKRFKETRDGQVHQATKE